MVSREPLTQEKLKALLDYNPETGVFRLRVARNGSRAKPGDVVGSAHSRGYIEVRIDRKAYLLHRLAWLYMTGTWPTSLIDHRNRIKTDNRWKNLRKSNYVKNSHNTESAHRDSQTGLLGVSPFKARFRAAIMAHGKYVSLGIHDTTEQAQAAYLAAKRKLHPTARAS